MMRIHLIVVSLAILFATGLYIYIGATRSVIAIGSRTVEFTLVVLDAETSDPIQHATIKLWDSPFDPTKRKLIAELVTDERGIARYIRENHTIEDVANIPATHKLQGVRRHPDGIGTFVDRFWCAFDIRATGYRRIENDSLGAYDYDDNGYDRSRELHQFEFTIPMRRR